MSDDKQMEADLNAALIKIEHLERAMRTMIDEVEMWSEAVRYAMPDNIYIPPFHIPARLRP